MSFWALSSNFTTFSNPFFYFFYLIMIPKWYLWYLNTKDIRGDRCTKTSLIKEIEDKKLGELQTAVSHWCSSRSFDESSKKLFSILPSFRIFQLAMFFNRYFDYFWKFIYKIHIGSKRSEKKNLLFLFLERISVGIRIESKSQISTKVNSCAYLNIQMLNWNYSRSHNSFCFVSLKNCN